MRGESRVGLLTLHIAAQFKTHGQRRLRTALGSEGRRGKNFHFLLLAPTFLRPVLEEVPTLKPAPAPAAPGIAPPTAPVAPKLNVGPPTEAAAASPSALSLEGTLGKMLAGGAAEAEEGRPRAGAKPPRPVMGSPPAPPAKGFATAMPADATKGPDAAEEEAPPKAGAKPAAGAGGRGRWTEVESEP